jgi:predicted HTH transcriptional regulator
MKSIAAFLTSRGGTLYLGVDDNSNIVGIEYDFRLLNEGKRNEDGWELQFRNLVTGNFKDGDNVNDHMDIRFTTIETKRISRVTVGSRKKLSFLKYKNSYHLFRRQGNRSEEVTIEQVEEFLALRAQV